MYFHFSLLEIFIISESIEKEKKNVKQMDEHQVTYYLVTASTLTLVAKIPKKTEIVSS